jgi:hypothetical protein
MGVDKARQLFEKRRHEPSAELMADGLFELVDSAIGSDASSLKLRLALQLQRLDLD